MSMYIHTLPTYYLLTNTYVSIDLSQPLNLPPALTVSRGGQSLAQSLFLCGPRAKSNFYIIKGLKIHTHTHTHTEEHATETLCDTQMLKYLLRGPLQKGLPTPGLEGLLTSPA